MHVRISSPALTKNERTSKGLYVYSCFNNLRKRSLRESCGGVGNTAAGGTCAIAVDKLHTVLERRERNCRSETLKSRKWRAPSFSQFTMRSNGALFTPKHQLLQGPSPPQCRCTWYCRELSVWLDFLRMRKLHVRAYFLQTNPPECWQRVRLPSFIQEWSGRVFWHATWGDMSPAVWCKVLLSFSFFFFFILLNTRLQPHYVGVNFGVLWWWD